MEWSFDGAREMKRILMTYEHGLRCDIGRKVMDQSAYQNAGDGEQNCGVGVLLIVLKRFDLND